MLGASAAANVITMLAVLYIAFGTPKVYVTDGYVDASVTNRVKVEVNDGTPIRVHVTRMP
ncbi:hypothetical protein AC630_39315 [Bradyrhizobium sp. AS23.2]|nr:hypothetical protein AC630_39315 [Bradyrhizobium sp. AS23.2]